MDWRGGTDNGRLAGAESRLWIHCGRLSRPFPGLRRAEPTVVMSLLVVTTLHTGGLGLFHFIMIEFVVTLVDSFLHFLF